MHIICFEKKMKIYKYGEPRVDGRPPLWRTIRCVRGRSMTSPIPSIIYLHTQCLNAPKQRLSMFLTILTSTMEAVYTFQTYETIKR